MKIKIKDKTIVEAFNHYVLELDLENFSVEENELVTEEITTENMDSVGGAAGNTTKKWLREGYPYAKGYVFRNENNEIVGSCWMMLKGGDEKLYKVRNVDVFMFRLEVVESYRGKKYSKKIMHNMVKMAKQYGCKKAGYVCATKNKIVLHLHAGLGAKIVGRRIFFRVFDKNIPYYTV